MNHNAMKQQKFVLRNTLLLQRRSVTPEERRLAGEQALKILEETQMIASNSIVAAYWPMPSEFDIHPIINWLHQQKITCALPAIVEDEKPLIFREFRAGDPLVDAPMFHVKQPPETARVVNPDILFIPLVSFDRNGYRLGLGAGFYDRTLAALEHPHAAIGLGFADSEVAEVPCEAHDIRMHAILTEKELIRTPL